jgi:hypothetical protein
LLLFLNSSPTFQEPYTLTFTPTVGLPPSLMAASLLLRTWTGTDTRILSTLQFLVTPDGQTKGPKPSFKLFFRLDSDEDALLDDKTIYELGSRKLVNVQHLEHSLHLGRAPALGAVLRQPALPPTLYAASPGFNASGPPTIFVLWPSTGAAVSRLGPTYGEEVIKLWSHYLDAPHAVRVELYSYTAAPAPSSTAPVSTANAQQPETKFVASIYETAMDVAVNPVVLAWDPEAVLQKAGIDPSKTQTFVIRVTSLAIPTVHGDSEPITFGTTSASAAALAAVVEPMRVLPDEPSLSWAGIAYSNEGSPFNTAAAGNKVQSLYLAEELVTARLQAYDKIFTIGFAIAEVPGRKVDNLRIAYALVPVASGRELGSSFVTTTVVYVGADHPPLKFTEGEDVEITLDTPIQWDGTSHLVIEVSHSSLITARGGAVMMRRVPSGGVRTIHSSSPDAWSDASYPYTSKAAPPNFRNSVMDIALTFGCSAQSECSDHGTCATQDTAIPLCACAASFYGRACGTECRAEDQCNGRGKCSHALIGSGEGICECDAGYIGRNCQLAGAEPLGLYLTSSTVGVGMPDDGVVATHGPDAEVWTVDPLSAASAALPDFSGAWANGTEPTDTTWNPYLRSLQTGLSAPYTRRIRCLYPASLLLDLKKSESSAKIDRVAFAAAKWPFGTVGIRLSISTVAAETKSLDGGIVAVPKVLFEGEADFKAGTSTSPDAGSLATSGIVGGPSSTFGGGADWLELSLGTNAFEYTGQALLLELEAYRITKGPLDAQAGLLFYQRTDGSRLMESTTKVDGSDVTQALPFLPRVVFGTYTEERPTVTSVSPTTVSPAGGTRITVLGSRLGRYADDVRGVWVGDKACTNVTWASSSSLSCTVPQIPMDLPDKKLRFAVTAATKSAGGLRSEPADGAYVSYLPPPRVDSLDPTSVSAGWSGNLTLAGVGFGSSQSELRNTTVGDMVCSPITWKSAERLLCSLKSMPAGTHLVRVGLTNGLRSEATALFLVQGTPTPAPTVLGETRAPTPLNPCADGVKKDSDCDSLQTASDNLPPAPTRSPTPAGDTATSPTPQAPSGPPTTVNMGEGVFDTTNLTFPDGNTHIIGEGPDKTIIRCLEGLICINLTDTSPQLFEGITFELPKSLVPAILMKRLGTPVHFKNCRFVITDPSKSSTTTAAVSIDDMMANLAVSNAVVAPMALDASTATITAEERPIAASLAIQTCSDVRFTTCDFTGLATATLGMLDAITSAIELRDSNLKGFSTGHQQDRHAALYAQQSQLSVVNTAFRDCRGRRGAAIFALDSTATLSECRLFGHAAALSGGALFLWRSRVRINSTTFQDNTVAPQVDSTDARLVGGAVHALFTDLIIGNTIFRNNSIRLADGVKFSGSGGALASEESTLKLDRSNFTANRAANGGAIFIEARRSIAVRDCSFDDNTASETGGALHVSLAGSLAIERCKYRRNTAGGSGGALNVDRLGSGRVYLSEFDSNFAGLTGGAVRATVRTASESDSYLGLEDLTQTEQAAALLLLECTLRNNSAKTAGGAIFVSPPLNLDSTAPTLLTGKKRGNAKVSVGLDDKLTSVVWDDCVFNDNNACYGKDWASTPDQLLFLLQPEGVSNALHPILSPRYSDRFQPNLVLLLQDAFGERVNTQCPTSASLDNATAVSIRAVSSQALGGVKVMPLSKAGVANFSALIALALPGLDHTVTFQARSLWATPVRSSAVTVEVQPCLGALVADADLGKCVVPSPTSAAAPTSATETGKATAVAGGGGARIGPLVQYHAYISSAAVLGMLCTSATGGLLVALRRQEKYRNVYFTHARGEALAMLLGVSLLFIGAMEMNLGAGGCNFRAVLVDLGLLLMLGGAAARLALLKVGRYGRQMQGKVTTLNKNGEACTPNKVAPVQQQKASLPATPDSLVNGKPASTVGALVNRVLLRLPYVKEKYAASDASNDRGEGVAVNRALGEDLADDRVDHGTEFALFLLHRCPVLTLLLP